MVNSYGVIYKVSNKVNGKFYIGQTIQQFDKRKQRHIQDAKNNKTTVFCKALRKYGEDNFLWEIIDHASNPIDLDNKEIYWIKYYNSYTNETGSNGYNMKLGGEGLCGENISNKFDNQKIIELFESAKTGNFSTITLAEKFNLSKSHMNNILNLDTGWNLLLLNHYDEDELANIVSLVRAKGSDEASQKLSELKSKENHHMWNKKGRNNPNSKPVIQLDVDSGKYIREFDSATEAGIFVGAADCSKIAMVCRGKRNKSFNYKWMYAEDYYKSKGEI